MYRWKTQESSNGKTGFDLITGFFRGTIHETDNGSILEESLEPPGSYSNLVPDTGSDTGDQSSRAGDEQYATRDYESAIAAYLEALAGDPDNVLIQRKLGYSYYSLGIRQKNGGEIEKAYSSLSSALAYYQTDWRFYRDLTTLLLELKRLDEAELVLGEGIKIADENAVFQRQMGYVKYSRKQYRAALPYLLKSIELNPQDLQTLQLLGYVYFSLGDTAQAREYVLRALIIHPEHPMLMDFLERVEREYQVEKDFSSRKGKHFYIKYDGEKREEIGFRVERILAAARAEIGSKLGYLPDQPVPVILYSQQDFATIAGRLDWSAGLYDGKIRLPIGGLKNDTPRLRQLLFHEYTHAILEKICKNKCPAWMNEGIAQYCDGRRISDWMHVLVLYRLDEAPVLFYQVKGLFTDMTDSALISIVYAQSLLAVEYMYNRFSNRQIQLVLQDIGNNIPVEQVLKNRLRLDYPMLTKEMQVYLDSKMLLD